MPTANINNVEIYYEQHGQGPDLILLSGFTADHNSWATFLKYLVKDFRVTILDNRGIGKSSIEDVDYSIELMAADVVALMDKLAIESAFIAGHSMGGFILQVLATQYANRVKKALFICSRIASKNAFNFHARTEQQLAQAGVSQELLLRHSMSFLFAPQFLDDDVKVDTFIKMALTNTEQPNQVGISGQLKALTAFDKLKCLSQIKIPAAALFGEDDLIALPKYAELIRKCNSNIHIKMLSNCGHMPQFEVPEDLAECFHEFFSG
jgi:pimeloyl-ACP methyl ester carboxylesterase